MGNFLPVEEPEPEAVPDPPLAPVFNEIELTQDSLSFDISWQETDLEQIDYYELQYKEIGSDWSASIEIEDNSYSFSGLDEKTYRFRTRAIDINGQAGDWSDELEIKISLSKGVVINEIAWMGTVADTSDEWIELYNTTESEIDLSGWTLKSEDESPNIIFSEGTIIDAGGYFLLERTDNDAISDILADFIFTGALKNSPNCEILYFYNANNQLIDKTVCLENGNWPAGQNSPDKISMERINSQLQGDDITNWQNNRIFSKNGKDKDNNDIYGTPRQPNSNLAQNIKITELPFDNFDELTFHTSNSPFIIWIDLIIPENKKLTIEKGVVLRINSGITITVEGEILAQGTEENKIIFTSFYDSAYDGIGVENSKNYWRQIILDNVDNSTKFENCVFKYGGVGRNQTAGVVMSIDGGYPEFNKVKFEKFVSYAMQLNTSSALVENSEFYGTIPIKIVSGNPTIKGNYFKGGSIAIDLKDSPALIKNNTFKDFSYVSGAIRVENGYPNFINNTFENNNINGVFVFGKATQNWILEPAVYVISFFEVGEDSILTIKPGVVMKFFKSGKISIDLQANITGKLRVGDLAGEPIVFTSILDDEYGGDTNNDEPSELPIIGDWDRVDILGGQESLFENVIFRYAGQNGMGAIYFKDSTADLNNIKIESSQTGIYSLNSDLTIDNSQFLDCGKSYACLKSENTEGIATNLKISNSVFKDSHIGLFVDETNLTLSNLIFENHTYFATYFKNAVNSRENCPDLSSVTFIGNAKDIYPDSCYPPNQNN